MGFFRAPLAKRLWTFDLLHRGQIKQDVEFCLLVFTGCGLFLGGAEKHHTLRVEGQQFLNLILLTLCTYSTALVLMRPAALAIHTQQQYVLARRGRAEWHLQMRPLVKLWSNLHFFPWTVDTVFHELTFHVLIYSLSCIVISTLDPNCSRLPDVSTKMLL